MELNSRKLSTLIIVILFCFITITIPWYINIGKVKIETLESKTAYSDLEASESFEDYDSNKIYFKSVKQLTYITRSWIPLCYNKKIEKTYGTNYSMIDK